MNFKITVIIFISIMIELQTKAHTYYINDTLAQGKLHIVFNTQKPINTLAYLSSEVYLFWN